MARTGDGFKDSCFGGVLRPALLALIVATAPKSSAVVALPVLFGRAALAPAAVMRLCDPSIRPGALSTSRGTSSVPG